MKRYRIEVREPLRAERPAPLVRLAAGTTIVWTRACDFGRHVELLVQTDAPPEPLHPDATIYEAN